MDQDEVVPQSLKTEARLNLVSAAMKFFRAGSFKEYDDVSKAFVEQTIRQIQARFETEGDPLKEKYATVTEAFIPVIDQYMHVSEAFDAHYPLEKQMELMFKHVRAPSSLLEINSVVVQKILDRRDPDIMLISHGLMTPRRLAKQEKELQVIEHKNAN